MTNYLARYMVDVPEGVSGDWRVERFTVSEEDAKLERLRAIFSGGRGVPAGTYTRLMCRGDVVMSDTPDEIRDHRLAIARATGRVLINGLGLGVVLQGMLNKPEVEHATVVEVAPDVIALVGPHYQRKFGERLTIVQADAMEYRPPKDSRFAVVWHDIWPNICADNLPEMRTLHRRYGRLADWQGSWGRELLR